MKNRCGQRKKRKTGFLCVASGAVCLGILLLLYKWLGYAAFGGSMTLASMDANNLYLDFLAYLKDCLHGENSIFYTYSKSLGGTSIAFFANNLSSPFNLLLLFFEKENLQAFFDWAIALKLTTAAVTMALFLQLRFEHKLRRPFVVLLSVSYALGQFSIAQSSNIQMLDGVYMIPLILLGVYRLVRGDKMPLLSLSVGASILFSWGMGGVNCLFAIAWFFFEFALLETERSAPPRDRTFLLVKKTLRFGIAMFIGMLLSGCLFLPMLLATAQGRLSGGFDWYLLTNTFTGNVFSVIEGFAIGARSTSSKVSLFCGSFALLGCISYLVKKGDLKKKLVVSALLVFVLLMFYWQPLYFLFSFFKKVSSFWSRYSYLGIFAIVFVAGLFYRDWNPKQDRIPFVPCALAFSGLLFGIQYISAVNQDKHIYYTAAAILLIAMCLTLIADAAQKKTRVRSFAVLLMLVSLVEIAYGAKALMHIYDANTVSAYSAYMHKGEEQIVALKAYDSGIYRVTQTSTRNMHGRGINLTANYNDSLALNYMSIVEYNSANSADIFNFLTRLGYRQNGNNMNIVNTSILPADSLLGVKYALSAYPIHGLELVEELGVHNEKQVYENPYALPFAFVYDSEQSVDGAGLNPFAYQNHLYSVLLGEEVTLFTPVEYSKEIVGKSAVYTLTIPEGNISLYGNLPWKSEMNATLESGEYVTAYSQWLSPSVFYIPTTEEDTQAQVTLTSDKLDALKEEQFYALDLDLLERVTGELMNGDADALVENGHISCTVDAHEGDKLFLSVPYDTGWEIRLNGETVQAERFADCLMTISLTEGTNEIEMEYHVPGLPLGIGLTCLGAVSLAGIILLEKKKALCKLQSKKTEEENA